MHPLHPPALLAVLAMVIASAAAQQGDIRHVHDPCIAKEGERFYVYSTHGGLHIRVSEDLFHWRRVGSVFEESPAWTTAAVPDSKGLWAPDVAYFNGRYHLYYSASTFGSNHSCVGLATNITLDPSDPRYEWVDHGQVIGTQRTDDWNAIDPAVFLDDAGQPWMALGSYWSGIKLVRLDSATGQLADAARPVIALAARPAPGAVEAPFVTRRDGWYYLWVSFDACCRGVESTYRIVVGRSRKVEGPYVDREGTPMLDGGGTTVLASAGDVRGPGHGAVLHDAGRDWLVHHYYDASASGVPTLQVRPIAWDADGWPSIGPPLDGPIGSR